MNTHMITHNINDKSNISYIIRNNIKSDIMNSVRRFIMNNNKSIRYYVYEKEKVLWIERKS